MKDTIFGIFCLVLGVFFFFLGIFCIVRNKLRGERVLDGRIIDIDLENKALIIRYKISRNNYQNIAFYKHVCFLPGAEMPPIGLKVTVKVKEDDLQNPISVRVEKNYGRGSYSKPYRNNSRAIMLTTWLFFSILFIFGGIMTLMGEF